MSSALESGATRTGARRTIYYTKQVEEGYARTHQYLGEWKDNKVRAQQWLVGRRKMRLPLTPACRACQASVDLGLSPASLRTRACVCVRVCPHLSQWDGKGTLEKTGGSRYVGEWKAGLRHGSGTLWQRHADGSMRKIYAGQWDNDQQHGRGTLSYKNKDVYVGEWHRGVRAGVGICTYADGGVYEGEWLNDKRHGFGVFDYRNGDHFEGHWIEDQKEGQGVHFYYHKEKKVRLYFYYHEQPGSELGPSASRHALLTRSRLRSLVGAGPHQAVRRRVGRRRAQMRKLHGDAAG